MGIFVKEIKNFFKITTKLGVLEIEDHEKILKYFNIAEENRLYVDPYDKNHDFNHIMRVCMYTYLLCQKLDITEKYQDMALMAALYHDAGLERNESSEGFCEKSATIFESNCKKLYSENDLNIIKKIISLCDTKSNEFDFSDLNVTTKTDKEQIKKIYSVVKDAKAIDRNRMDYTFSKCKPRYLRFDESKKMLEMADSIIFEFKKSYFRRGEEDDEERFNRYYSNYAKYAQRFVPVRNQVIEGNLLNDDTISQKLGDNAKDLYKVPDLLYYVSYDKDDVKKDKNGHVIANENLMEAVFNVVFNNSRELKYDIVETFNKDGKYAAKYSLDERIKDALNNTIKKGIVYIHVFDSNLFYRLGGKISVDKEWASRSYRKVEDVDLFQLDVDDLLNSLKTNSLLNISKWNKEKGYQDVVKYFENEYLNDFLNDGDTIEASKNLENVVNTYWSELEKFANVLHDDVDKILSKADSKEDNKDKAKKTQESLVDEVKDFLHKKFYTQTNTQWIYNISKKEEYLKSKIDVHITSDTGENKIITGVKIVETEAVGTVPIIKEKKGFIGKFWSVILLSAIIGLVLGGIIAAVCCIMI